MTIAEFPGFDHLFQVHDPISNRAFRGHFPDDVDALLVTRGEHQVEAPVTVEWAMGGRAPAAVIWTTAAHPVLIHERLVSLLEVRTLTGWRTYPVEVVGRRGERWNEYHGLVVTGRCARADLGRSEIVLREYPGGWFPDFAGHFFDPASWDGSDIFMTRADSLGRVTGSIFATAGVLQAFQDARARNVKFTRLTDVSVSTSVYEVGLRDLLPADFEERVARAYLASGVPRPPGRVGA